MKKLNLNRNLLTAGVALALGVSSTGIAVAGTALPTGGVSPTTGVTISNEATATYQVDGQDQPKVTSEAVVVNVNEIANFTLFATKGDATDDKNENQAATPGGTTEFTHKLTNTGNIADTYTIQIADANEPSITTGNKDYSFSDIANKVINYTVKNASGTPLRTSTVANGGQITLQPGEYAELSYSLTTPKTTDVVGGKSGVSTLTATSAYITKADPTKQAYLVNENQAIVKLPVFSINKTAANTSINLNDANPEVTYTITVKNDGSVAYAADAVGVLIQDKLPKGLTVKGGTSDVIVSSTVNTTTDGIVKIISGTDGQILAVEGVALKVGETISITFTALIDKKAVDASKPLVNNADVYDNYGDTPVTAGDSPTADIEDGTGSSNDSKSKVPNDPNDPTAPGGDKGSELPFTNRNLTLTGGSTAELPPSSPTAPAKYTQTITNNGNTPETGLTFAITDTPSDNIATTKVIYDPTPDDPNSGDEKELTPVNGKYTIPEDIQPNQKVGITYEVTTNNAKIGASDTSTLTLYPAPQTGTTTPAPTSTSNITTVQGLKLVKEQAIDEKCDGTLKAAFTTNAIDAKPGQCVVYRITATNTSTTKELTKVEISDAASQWNTKATYKINSGKDSANGSVSSPGDAVKSSALTIPAGQSGWLQFTIQINTATNKSGGSSAQ